MIQAQAIHGTRIGISGFFSTSKILIFLPLNFHNFNGTIFGYYELVVRKVFFAFLFLFF